MGKGMAAMVIPEPVKESDPGSTAQMLASHLSRPCCSRPPHHNSTASAQPTTTISSRG